MATEYALRTFADIQAAVREELKISAADTVAINRIKRDINIIYRDLIAKKRWWWMAEQATITTPEAYGTGTAQVVHGSSSVVLSQVVFPPKEGHFFSINGDNELYTVESHEPGSATIKLSGVYNGVTQFAAHFKIWTDRVPLPTNCKETVEVTSGFARKPLENLGLQEFRRLTSGMPKREGHPEVYYTSDFSEPFPDSDIPSLPTFLHHYSSGTTKTLVFASALPASLINNTALRIKSASHPSYNGEISIASISQTTVARDTLTYTGFGEYSEQGTPDSDIKIKLLNTTANRSRYRALSYYPAINTAKLTLALDYQKNVPNLVEDTDEPLIPYDDRIVLLYGALCRGWVKERNDPVASANKTLYDAKWAEMAGYVQDSLDKPTLLPSKIYLSSKRNGIRSRRFSLDMNGFPGTSGGSTGGTVVATLGTPNTAATFNASGELEGSAAISVAELNYLDGASSNIQNQINTINSTISSAFITNTLVAAGAAIAKSKLAAGTASRVEVTDGSGVMTESAVTSTELTFLSGVTPLTSATLVDNTAAPTAIISIPQTNTLCFIIFSIKRNTAFEGGTINLINDGAATAAIGIDSTTIGANGVALTADTSGGNVRILYTTTNTGFNATLKYAVIKWAA